MVVDFYDERNIYNSISTDDYFFFFLLLYM